MRMLLTLFLAASVLEAVTAQEEVPTNTIHKFQLTPDSFRDFLVKKPYRPVVATVSFGRSFADPDLTLTAKFGGQSISAPDGQLSILLPASAPNATIEVHSKAQSLRELFLLAFEASHNPMYIPLDNTIPSVHGGFWAVDHSFTTMRFRFTSPTDQYYLFSFVGGKYPDGSTDVLGSMYVGNDDTLSNTSYHEMSNGNLTVKVEAGRTIFILIEGRMTSQAVDSCTWLTPATKGNLRCRDHTECPYDADNGTCCNSKGGRAACPADTKMCAQPKACASDQDYCCDATCDSLWGERICGGAFVVSIMQTSAPPPPPSNDHGLSGGGVFLIILTVLSATYCLCGCLLNYQNGARACPEMIPNIAFWRELPSLVQDGWRYMWILICGAGSLSARETTRYSEVPRDIVGSHGDEESVSRPAASGSGYGTNL